MSILYFVIAFIGFSMGLSLRERKLYDPKDRIPMSWGLDGAVGWSARRDLALFFWPVFVAIVLIFIFVMIVATNLSDHKSGYITIAVNGLVMIAIQIVHFHFARKSAGQSR